MNFFSRTLALAILLLALSISAGGIKALAQSADEGDEGVSQEAMSEAERNEPMRFFCTLMGLEREMFPSAMA